MRPEIEADGFITVHVYEPPPVLDRGSAIWTPFARRVLSAVSRHTFLSTGRIRGRDRGKPAVRSRDAVVWLLRECTGNSLSEIGRNIGGRDHTTIGAAIRRAERRRETDTDFRGLTNSLRERFMA